MHQTIEPGCPKTLDRSRGGVLVAQVRDERLGRGQLRARSAHNVLVAPSDDQMMVFGQGISTRPADTSRAAGDQNHGLIAHGPVVSRFAFIRPTVGLASRSSAMLTAPSDDAIIEDV